MKHKHPTHTTLTYDARGRLSGVCRRKADGTLLECVTYVYDDAGHRVPEAADAAKITTWTYDDEGELLAE